MRSNKTQEGYSFLKLFSLPRNLLRSSSPDVERNTYDVLNYQ